ncbi:MAG TPA: hypothetical protein VM933_04440 [Acidimicrobiales bacterium]|nr:hypothetical protein [Acidimicrobiales bacterium]
MVGRPGTVAAVVLLATAACGGGSSAPETVEGGSDPSGTPTSATATGSTRRYTVPRPAQASYCAAADLLRAAPAQPTGEADASFRRAAQHLDQARGAITATGPVELATRSSLAALTATVRSASIATTTGDDAGRRAQEASIQVWLSQHVADCD